MMAEREIAMDRFIWLLAGALVLGVLGLHISDWFDGIHDATKLELCHQAAACKKYSDVRQQCATAGNFKTCMLVKMGDDASWIDTCSGFVEGGAALPLPPQTPNSADCFFRTLFMG
jgi:hypothetical protein